MPDAGVPGPYVRESLGIYRCTRNRPRVCNALTSPVCARRVAESQNDDAGAESNADYINGCMACSDPSVVSYVVGRCAYRGKSTLSAPTPNTEER